jgi:ParE-like toxin of type II ParDE toxin-antitoxin system
MTQPVVFRFVARCEYDEAVTGYQGERAGLGLEFKDAVDEVLARIAAMPLIFRAVRGPVRRAVVKRFPYTIHFLSESDRIVVLAVYHAAREPGTLESRR